MFSGSRGVELDRHGVVPGRGVQLALGQGVVNLGREREIMQQTVVESGDNLFARLIFLALYGCNRKIFVNVSKQSFLNG